MTGAALVLLVMTAPPAATSTAEELVEATRLLREVREEQAVLVLTRALDRGTASDAERAQLSVLLGIARLNLHDEEGARLAFRRALEAQPTVSLPRLAPPKSRALFEAERRDREERPPAPRPAPPGPELTAAAPSAPARRPVGLGLGIAGVVGAGVGVYLVLDSQALRQQAQLEPGALQAQRLFQDAQTRRTWGWIAVGAGAALAVGGALLALWPEPEVGLKVTVGPASLGLAGRF